jgi:triacylglycerol lipase
MGRKLESALGVLNGTVGDYLDRTGNGLATAMNLVADGAPLEVDRNALARTFPDATPRAVLLVHGSMCTERVWQPRRTAADGGTRDYGALLRRDLGYTPLYLRYNTGLAIPDNGAALAALLEELVDAFPLPLEELLLIGHSMGGLVMRSACLLASSRDQRWLRLVRRAIYIGTPHLGAPLERLGRVVARVLEAVPDPYTRLAAEVGNLRSDGIKDLGDADLRHEDRERRVARMAPRDRRHPVPLPPGIRHYLVAATLSESTVLASLVGDVLVPVPSATGPEPQVPPNRVEVLPGVGHFALARHPQVYARIRAWCGEEA